MKLRLSFRARLLLALVGLVGVLLGVTLLAVRAQTRRQVDVAVRTAVKRSQRAFAELEGARRDRLRGEAGRFLASNRFPAALDEAVSTGAVDVLVQNTLYDLQLANILDALTAFTDYDAAPVAAVIDGKPLADPAAAVPAGLAEGAVLEGRAAFGYHLVDGRLFDVHTVPLVLFGNAIGSMTLGLPVDERLASTLGASVGGEVCFVAGGRCVVATAGARESGRMAEMAGAAGSGASRRVRWNGRRMALVADRIGAEEGARDLWRVIAIPLDDVISPFDRIQDVVMRVGVGALALAVLLGMALSRSLARPVRALVRATGAIARGDYSARVNVASRDELGRLAGAFNAMAEGLMLKERYRGVLDKVVSREIADELLKGEITLGGEARRVTTLFADLRGFTALTEGMPPERVIALVNEFMEAATEAIHAEGGVVDKYVGDEVMALFGAPLALDDAPGRAVRAAVRIRDAAAALSRRRVERGEAPIAVGVGVNTGDAVAGNMGSTGRLNYTVLGESVNLAARLCGDAAPGEILATGAVLDAARAGFDAVPLGPRAFKGLSVPIPVFSIQGIASDDPSSPSDSASTVSTSIDRESTAGTSAEPASLESPSPSPAAGIATVLAVALLAGASPATAQALPTFEELGIGWTSADGTFQVTPSGRLDLELFAPGEVPVGLIPETGPFVGGRVSLFLDLLAGRHLQGSIELRADRGEAPRDDGIETRIEQAFVRVIPSARVDLAIQAGKFVSPFGGYPQRHHTAADPFIRPPLPYDHRTMVTTKIVPGRAARWLQWKDEPETFRAIGAPPVWGVPYQVGAMVSGGWRGVSGRVALMNGAPSSEPEEWNDVFQAGHGPSWVAHLGVRIAPELRVGVSYDVGAFLVDEPENGVPAGRRVSDYTQEIWGFEAAFARGPVEARGEVLLDRWEVPNVPEDARDVSYYVETKVKLSAGLFAAARYGAIHFNEIAPAPDAEAVAWDYDARRVQFGAGYRLSRATELRAEYLLTLTDAPPEGNDDLFAIRWSYAF